MDMFQKDLKNYRILLKNNREEHNSKKNEKKELELEISNAKFELFEIEQNFNKNKLIKQRIKRYNNKLKQLKKKVGLSLLIIFAAIFSLNISGILTLNMSVLFSSLLFSGVLVYGLNKANYLIAKRKEILEGKSLNEINDTQKKLMLEKDKKFYKLQELNFKVENINSALDRLDIIVQKLYEEYNYIVDYYQNVVSEINPKINNTKFEEQVNRKHEEALPVLSKRLFGKKHD